MIADILQLKNWCVKKNSEVVFLELEKLSIMEKVTPNIPMT